MNAPDVRMLASEWHARLQRDAVPAEAHAEFQHWLDEQPEHRAAYDATDEAWKLMRGLIEHPQILALRQEAALDLTRSNTRSNRVSFRIAAAVAVLAVGVAMAMVVDVPGWMSGKGRYSTTLGERVVIALADDSQMTLNTQTRIRTAFTESERRVVLKEGQALFEVAKDARRPFIVEAVGREFIAVGTAFDVRVDGGHVQVTMVEGSVKVPNTGDSSEAVLIRAGDQIRVGASSPDPAPQGIGSAGVERAISWRNGQVIFDNTPLSEAVAELNRYSEQKIVLSDSALGGFRVSGVFATGKAQAFVEVATVYFPVEVARQDARSILLKARLGANM